MAELGVVDSETQGKIVRIGFTDSNVKKRLKAGFRRVLFERSVDGGLSFNEISAPSARLVLEEDTPEYCFIDPLGDANFLYRTRYITDKGVKSDPSESIEGAGALLLNILTPAQLRERYLFGLDLTNDDGQPLPDVQYQHYILTGIEWLQHALDIPILPTTFIREFHDYYRTDYPEFNIINLDNYPVISLEEFRVEYPSGQTVVNFPLEWIRLDKVHGIVRIVPTAGTLSEIIIGQGGSFLPAVYSGLDSLPDLFAISYTAGFADGKIPTNLLDLIGKRAALGPLNIFGDLVAGAGIANISTSIDGLSQTIGTTSSATNAGFGARILQYTKEMKAEIPNLIRYYKGIRMRSV